MSVKVSHTKYLDVFYNNGHRLPDYISVYAFIYDKQAIRSYDLSKGLKYVMVL